MVGLARGHHPHAMLAGETDGVAAAGLRYPLANPVAAVKEHARPGLGDHRAVGDGVHFACQKLVDIVGQKLDPVRIDAAQVGSHQRMGDNGSLARGSARGEQNGFAESGECSGGDNAHETSSYREPQCPCLGEVPRFPSMPSRPTFGLRSRRQSWRQATTPLAGPKVASNRHGRCRSCVRTSSTQPTLLKPG